MLMHLHFVLRPLIKKSALFLPFTQCGLTHNWEVRYLIAFCLMMVVEKKLQWWSKKKTQNQMTKKIYAQKCQSLSMDFPSSIPGWSRLYFMQNKMPSWNATYFIWVITGGISLSRKTFYALRHPLPTLDQF